jgi:hypothetical protein
VPFELEPDVRGAFGYAPPARLRFDDPKPVAADALESRAPNAALEAGAVVDDLDPSSAPSSRSIATTPPEGEAGSRARLAH